ncbi:MAG: tyrosine-protein phosphatase [Paracoccaceae bacterium]|jgi:protein tyrosine/serine phosphatase|uniref:fused DSP-PTPase phosphatase/NAD kinase-like protein n=1 Tax=unclassified Seohaeicola TaxID=2641111 RepID=UPI00237A6DF3|nr:MULTISPECIES: tyrosine-protein phosphatase [unclassified Seohaeicola]MDD9708214.1 tyrosine-protein phosphatase [Seohaeicola sp. 4SK31]MDD9736388.1 tyrosine-protein phosphatase [Seohaeicola sp. SP36]MDF1707520.1 tyrosine-protein phosphatase [Paracoccaceae bacterium]MDM7969460.1 tyrosine-protein phosphatase [Paracoccaceae bacterium]
MNPLSRLLQRDRPARLPSEGDLSDPGQRRRAFWAYQFMDHAILRHVWSNFDQIAPGVYRSNQPGHWRLKRYRAMGIKTVLYLRASSEKWAFHFERESLDALGMTMISAPLHSRSAPTREAVQTLIAAFRSIDKPFLMHCKSGADRAGLASAIYLMVIEGKDLHAARKMLSLRYIHLRFTKTGVLDLMLDHYAARNAASPIGFEDWIDREYDAAALQAAFDASRA